LRKTVLRVRDNSISEGSTLMAFLLHSRIATIATALVLTACAVPQQPPPMSITQGKIEQITPTTIRSEAHTGVGAVVGGLTGLGLGSLIGGGTGRDVAMVTGAIGGTMAGAHIANNAAGSVAGQEIFVRTDSGVLVEVSQPVTPGLRVGQRVFIQGQGHMARVVPQ
jgi:outer membrane lipoprotein SlyB